MAAERLSVESRRSAQKALKALYDTPLIRRRFLHIQARTLAAKLCRLLLHAELMCVSHRDSTLFRIFPNVLCNPHAAELWPAHRTEVSCLRRFGGQRFVMKCLCTHWIERKVELIPPAKLEACLGQCIVPDLRPGVSLRKVRRMCCDFYAMTPSLTSSLFGSPRCSLGVT
jgi:hypothetical protein